MRHRAPVVTAALACALTVAACGGEPHHPAPASGAAADAGSTAAPEAAIPDDFPLAAGMGGPRDTVPTSRTGTGLRDLELCGTTPLRGLAVRDRMVADNSGGESADTRDLAVLGAPGDATRMAERIAELVTDCTEPGPSGGAATDVETRTQVLASPFGPRPAATLLQTYTFDGEAGTGATVVHVVPVGAALLVTSTYGRWTRDDADRAVNRTVGPLRVTVRALAMFDDGSVPTG
jgi:hypothetical protein